VAAGLFCLLLNDSAAQSTRPGWGAIPYADSAGTGVTFRVWAPNATSLTVFGSFNGWNTNNLPLVRELPASNGVWSLDVAAARPGHEYKFSINHQHRRRDPRARQVIHSGEAPAVIHDPAAYRWSTPPMIPPPHDQLVVYELHIGTFGGTFTGADGKLNFNSALGANAIQLMPVAEFAGDHSWGYNPSDPFAVESAYGGPDAFKAFVDACHARGLAVLMDVVHNHYGPDDLGNSLWAFDGWSGPSGGGIYFYQDAARSQTKWGPRPDYGRPEVRQYILDNLRMWIEEFRVDGFRWDATLYMRFTTNFTVIADGERLLRDIGTMMAEEFPEKLHIAEDHINDGLITAPLTNGFGFHSEWYRPFHEILSAQLTNDAGRDLETLATLIRGSNHTARLIYTESHDEAGDHNADEGAQRFPAEMAPADPTGLLARKKTSLASALLMTSPGLPMLFQGQELLETSLFSDLLPVDWSRTNTQAGFVRLHRDLAALRLNRQGVSAGLTGSLTETAVTNNGTLLIVRRGLAGQPAHDVVVLANLSSNYVDGYWIDFPTNGLWQVHLNSDHAAYGPGFTSWGSSEVFVWEDLRGNPYLAPWSVLVLSRIPPAATDSDRDGLPDTWETAHGLDPFNGADAGRNPDGDAYSHRDEFRAGTAPLTWNLPASAYASLGVAGDFNGWNPSASPMARIADHLWQRDFVIQATRMEFKFTANNSWDVNWGIVSQTVFRAPMTLAAEPVNDNIVVSNLTAGATYRFRFHEQTRTFTVRRIALADSDLDDLPDAWELLHGLDPLRNPDRFANPDGDLYDNQEEFRRGLNPVVWNAPLTAYNNLRIQGSFALTSPFMAQDPSNHYTWMFTTNLVQTTGMTFRFVANGDPNLRWAANTPATLSLPANGTATFGGNFLVAVTQSLHGTYRFTFNESNRAFSLVSTDPDTDGDGLPDWWELQFFGHPTNAAPLASPDGDVYTNLEEYRRAMNPAVFDLPRANVAAMAIPGTANNWNPSANGMTLVDHHVWRAVVTFTNALNPQFKFAANGTWTDNWGHGLSAFLPMGGTAVKSESANMQINGVVDGPVVITFNDATLAYTASYDPTYAELDLMPTADGRWIIRWNSAADQRYHLYRGTNLAAPYALIASNLAATPPMNTYTDPAPATAGGFYRVVVNP